MTKLKFIATAALLAAVVGCAKDDIDTSAQGSSTGTSGDVYKLYAVAESSLTRVSFTDNATEGISLSWAEGDSFSVYEKDGDWVGDFTYTKDVEGEGEFSAADVTLEESTDYVALFPARPSDALATHTDYLSYDFTSSQTQSGSAMGHLNAACQMSDEFQVDEQISFAHNKSIYTVVTAITATPSKLTFTEGSASYTLNYTDMEEINSGTLTSYIMVEPTISDGGSDVVITVTYADATVDNYAITTNSGSEAGYRYTFDTVTDAEYFDILLSYLQIYNETELVAYLASPSSNAILMDNIDLDGETVVISSSDSFQSVFDGNNFEIQNFSLTVVQQYSGLFRSIGPSGVVKNLTLTSPNLSGSCTDVGTITGDLYGTISNCTVTSGVVSTSSADCGGIAGKLSGGKISNCSYSGTVTGANKTGGIVGATTASASTIEDCNFTGTVSGAINVGGILGNNLGADLARCRVLSTSSVSSTVTSGNAYIGGIVGNILGDVTIEACENYGSVTSTRICVGGIAGGVETATISPIIMGCVNGGTIQGGNRTGGIIGYSTLGNIVACYNTGTLQPTTSATAVGGIVGYYSNNAFRAVGCYSTGEITNVGSDNGNIAGDSTSPTVALLYCYYYGTAYTNAGTYVSSCASIDELNTAVESMNTAIEGTDYDDYIYKQGATTSTDLPTLILNE